MAARAPRSIIATAACSTATACSRPCGCGAGGSGCSIIIWSGFTEGCRRLKIDPPAAAMLRDELASRAAQRTDAVLKLIVTRGIGPRGYRPSGQERCTRVISLHALPRGAAGAVHEPVRMRVCDTRLGANPALAGLKTLNRLESVMARGEWRDARVWEGLMRDVGGQRGLRHHVELVLAARVVVDDARARSLRHRGRHAPLGAGAGAEPAPASARAPSALAGDRRSRGGVHDQCRGRNRARSPRSDTAAGAPASSRCGPRRVCGRAWSSSESAAHRAHPGARAAAVRRRPPPLVWSGCAASISR